jgi:hypothetical protein
MGRSAPLRELRGDQPAAQSADPALRAGPRRSFRQERLSLPRPQDPISQVRSKDWTFWT